MNNATLTAKPLRRSRPRTSITWMPLTMRNAAVKTRIAPAISSGSAMIAAPILG